MSVYSLIHCLDINAYSRKSRFELRREHVQNPHPYLGIRTEIGSLWSIPGHQQGIRCKAPRSDDRGVWSNTPQGGAIEGNAADDALMVDQGP